MGHLRTARGARKVRRGKEVNNEHPGSAQWPIHVKHVRICNELAIMADMSTSERAAYERCLDFFREPFLSNIAVSGPSIIELTMEQVMYLIDVGLFVRMPEDTVQGLRIHIFLVPEPHKERYRLIVHTIDINNATDDPGGPVDFTPLQDLIERILRERPVAYQNDVKSCYHQFPISPHLRKYYAFYVNGIGWISLATIATGQRQCVSRAQQVGRFLRRRVEARCKIPSHALDVYVDNYLGTRTPPFS